MKRFVFIVAALAIGMSVSQAQAASEFRNTIRIVGSSTVFPFAAFVAEKYYRKFGGKSPVVESTGSGGGIKMFCAGIGVEHADIVNASRRMKVSEIRDCAEHNVHQISEIMIGWDGISIAHAKEQPAFNLTRHQLWKALAKRLPIDGQFLDNPHNRWSHIDPSLPDILIQVFGPPPTSGTRDVFVEEVMWKGCRGADLIENLDEETRKVACGEMREDGVYVEAGEDDDLIVRRLKTNPNALGLMGYNALERRSNIIAPMSIDGVEPSFESIYDGSYPLVRPLFLYVKNDHINVVDGIAEFLNEFISEAAIGEEGYLTERGLIPLQDDLGRTMKAQVLNLTAK